MKTHDKHRVSLTKLLVSLAALMFFSQVHALGLGKLRVRSALDEPLVAEIELNAVTDAALETLELSLGSMEEFKDADIERPSFLSEMEFQVDTAGKPIVIISTTEPATEPFLHFIIKAQWSEGEIVREYTALLDPPLYTAEKPIAVSTPGVVEETRELMAMTPPATSPAESEPVLPQSQPPESEFETGGAEYGPTLRGDTLWDIASQFDTRGYDVNVFQVMIALLRQNPDAFVDSNINRLKVGQILRLSDLDVVQSLPKDDASLNYRTQLAEWESYKSQLAQASEELMIPVGEAAQGEAAGAGESEEAVAEAEAALAESEAAMAQAAESETDGVGPASTEQDLLKIVQATLDETPGETATASGTAAEIESIKATAEQEMNALREQINTLEESLVSRELQNNELRQRVEMLEGQIENATRLVELESEDLARVQQQAALAEQQAQEAAEQAMLAEQVAAQTQQEQVQAQQEQAQTEKPEPAGIAKNNVVEPIPVEQPAPKAEKTRVVAGGSKPAAAAQPVSQTARSKSWWESALATLQGGSMSMIAGIVGVLVLLSAALLFIRRRRSIAEFEESILSGSGLDEQTESTETAATGKGTDTSFLSDFGMAGMGSMQADEVDPLAEAEVYLAYGRDEQAEEVLKEAAARNPTRHELKLKLLEIYQQRDDVKSFETLAEELYPAAGQGDLTTWHKVAEMGLKMSPENPLFTQELPGGLAEPLADPENLLPAGASDLMPDADLPDDIVSESGRSVDPALRPFPEPDKNVVLDEELDRLTGSLEKPVAVVSAGMDSTPPPVTLDETDTLKFSTGDESGMDFDIDLGDIEDLEDDKSPVADQVELEVDMEDVLAEPEEELTGAVMEFETGEPVTAKAPKNGNGSGNRAEEGDGEDLAEEDDSEQWDEAATKLDLAQAYLNMGDKAGARSIIDEVMKEGSPAQRNQAAELAAQLS